MDLFLTFYERVLGLWVFSFNESTEISARFHRKVLRKGLFTKITFLKSVHADFFDYLDVKFVVSVFDPNNYPVWISIDALLVNLYARVE